MISKERLFSKINKLLYSIFLGLLKFCFSYDPEGRKYVFNILRVVGTLLLLWIVGIFLFVSRAKKINPLDRFEDDEEEGGSS